MVIWRRAKLWTGMDQSLGLKRLQVILRQGHHQLLVPLTPGFMALLQDPWPSGCTVLSPWGLRVSLSPGNPPQMYALVRILSMTIVHPWSVLYSHCQLDVWRVGLSDKKIMLFYEHIKYGSILQALHYHHIVHVQFVHRELFKVHIGIHAGMSYHKNIHKPFSI